MRTFIAIDLEKKIKENISLLIARLDSGASSVKWVEQQGMHLTLKFLGEVSDSHIPIIESALEKIAQKHKSFPLIIKGTGTFPPGKKIPRVFWLGVEGTQVLNVLHFEIETELEKLGFSREKRKYHPHLTLGRVKKSLQLGSIMSEFEKNLKTHFGEMVVNKITFFKSHP